MGIDLTTLLAGLTGGAQGLGTAVQQDDQRKHQQALDAMNFAVHQATMQKFKDDAIHQQNEDAKNGIRQGVAPNGGAINTGLDLASGLAGSSLPGAASLTTPIATAQARADAPDQYAPDRFQQLTAQSYLDKSATPEAVAERARVAADKIKQTSAAAELENKASMLVGTRLPDGTIVDRPLARAMVANPQLASAYTRPAPVPKEEPTVVLSGTGPDGKPHIFRVPKVSGPAEQVDGIAPKETATHNAEQQKEQKRVELMQQGYGLMETNAPRIRPNAIALAIHSPGIANMALTKAEQDYLLGLRNFIAGEMHAESGARLSKDQLAFGFQRYGPQFGDQNGVSKLAEARRALEGSQRSFGGGTPTPAPDVRNDAPVDPILQKYNLTPRTP